MNKSFFNLMLLIIAGTLIAVGAANAQDFTDGQIIHMRGFNDTLTDANLVEFGETLQLPRLDLYFRVTIKDDMPTGTLINVATLVPTNQTTPTPTFHYKEGNQWLDLTTATSNGVVQIQYSALKNIATEQNASSVEIGVKFTSIPGYRFQVQLSRGTAASDSIDRIYFDCHPGTHSPAVYDVTNDGLINNDDITAVSQAITDNSLTGDVSEDGRINTVDFNLVTFAVAQGMVISNRAPLAVKDIPDIVMQLAITPTSTTIEASGYFSDPDGDTLTYTASSFDTTKVTVSVSGTTVTLTAVAAGDTAITVTATDPDGLSAKRDGSVTVNQQSAADAIPGLSSEEQLLLGELLTYDTFIFNELHNASDDTNDWLELRNVSGAALALDDWQLTIHTGSGERVIEFPAGTVIPAGEVLLLVNTDNPLEETPQQKHPLIQAEAVLPIISEAFVLPQAAFALILRSPTAFGDIAGNYLEGETEHPQTASALTADTVWYRIQPTLFGYRAEAWAESIYHNGLGTPGYRHPTSRADLNNDGVVNILDLVQVASQFGTHDPTAADLNNDGTVDEKDLVSVAQALTNTH